VQNPRSDAARWNLAYAYHQAGYTPTAIAPLMQSGPVADLARLTSPADWECLMVVSSVVIAIAIITLLFLAYGIGPRWCKWPALVLVFVGLFIVGGSLAGRSAYGVAAHPQAVLVWRAVTLYSIPTEADTAQQTTTLAAGAMGTIDKTFLGWVRLSFPNGQTGWVRKTEFVPLWR
jgi:RsiW-degrading membrane proteinase PrsW (M82 family)